MFYCKSRISTSWWKGTQGLQTSLPLGAGLSLSTRLCLDEPWKNPSCPSMGTCPRVSQYPAWTCWSHCPDPIGLAPCSCPRSGCCRSWQGELAVPRLPPVLGVGRAQRRPQSQDSWAPALVYPCGRLPTAATCVSRSDLC